MKTLFRRPSSRAARRRSRRRERLVVEPLEQRALLAILVGDVLGGTRDTILTGVVYEDLNANGLRDNGEEGATGWTIFLDLDNSGSWNTDAEGVLEPASVTDQDGTFLLRNLQPGIYRLAEVVPAGWTPTSPVFSDVTVTRDRETWHDFFNFGGGSVVGTVWSDLDGDGLRRRDPDSDEWIEPGLAGWTVFVDLDTDGTLDPGEPQTTTDTEGRYRFTGLAAGDYEVTEILPEGWDVTRGGDLKQTVAVVAVREATLDFGNLSTVNGAISGVIWNDTTIDGIRATDPDTGEFTEPGLAGWTVFLDLDSDGVLAVDDDGIPLEPATVTDADGRYGFANLAAGDYVLRQLLPPGFEVAPGFDGVQTITVEAGRTSIAEDFVIITALNGGIRGLVWNDLNRNGIRDATALAGYLDPGIEGWTVFLDLDRDGQLGETEPVALTDADGGYAFADLQVGWYEVRQVLPTGWETATGFSDSVEVRIPSGTEAVAPDFAVLNALAVLPARVSGTVWTDTNGDGLRGGGDDGVEGWTVFADADGDGSLGAEESAAVTAADGSYTITGISPGTTAIVAVAAAGWRPTAPLSRVRVVAPKNGASLEGIDFGFAPQRDASLAGLVFVDANANGQRDPGEPGLADATVYLDLDDDGSLDPAEPRVQTSGDLFYTPDRDETGEWSFPGLAAGDYTVRVSVPAAYSATPANQLVQSLSLAAGEARGGLISGLVARDSELHGTVFDDRDGDGVRDPDEGGRGGVRVYVDIDRDGVCDDDEPVTTTSPDGSYGFVGLPSGGHVVREEVEDDRLPTAPATSGGTLWPAGTSNPAVGDVSPASLTASLGEGESLRATVSITLPDANAVSNLVDVFLLFDDTGSFVNNSPIVRAAFPEIITQLQAALPGVDLAFGVGRFEEYAGFGSEYPTGRPFILNQPIVAADVPGATAAIQSALDRTTPGYGGDAAETDIEALYQLVTGAGFDGNGNGSTSDSGPAGRVATQLTPGFSGDVPAFESFQPDEAHGVLPPSGPVGGGGFRPGALPIILTATDTGFAFQPKGETLIRGANGITVPVASLAGSSRATTPRAAGAGLQETVTALNALGALVIGLGTNAQPTAAPRQGLEALSMLTGAVNRTTDTIPNGTADPVAAGDPLYFQIASGFSSSVSSGVVSAILTAATTVAIDITVQASDPRVRLINHSGTARSIGGGQTATFDVEFVGDGIPRRFDLQFVREGSNVVLGSIPVVLGTPVPGECFDFTELEDGEISEGHDFGSRLIGGTSVAVPAGETLTDAAIWAGSERLVKQGAGTLVLDHANSHSGGTLIEAGEVIVRDVAALGLGGVEIRAGGRLSLDVGNGQVGLAGLTIQDSGSLDVGLGSVLLPAGSYDLPVIQTLIGTGRNGGSWTGAGITSQAAGSDPSLAVGHRVGGDGGLQIGFAAVGDATLDGTVDIQDLIVLDAGGKYSLGGATAGWWEGDFTFDGRFTINDLIALSTSGLYGTGSYRPATPASAAASSRPLSIGQLAWIAIAADEVGFMGPGD